MNDKNKFVAQIGLGYWGKNILRNFYELGALSIACDTSPEVISERQSSFPDIQYCSSPDEVFANDNIKAVAIASPAVTHYELVKKSLLSGKDVYVEKPLALTVGEAEELVNLAAEKNQILMVGHILQYHSAVIKLKELIGGMGAHMIEEQLIVGIAAIQNLITSKVIHITLLK